MKRSIAVVLMFAASMSVATPCSADAQLGGFIKKKATDVAKGEANKKGDASTSKADSCGPITPQKVKDFLRGLQAEGSARNEFARRC